jgi:dephospho-CoA kinase
MIIIGLTGSIAMGKSEVAKIFRSHGIPVFDADAAVSELYDSEDGTALLAKIVPEATRHRSVDRAALKQALQSDSQLLPKIESLVHAHVRKARDAFIANCRGNGHRMIVLDVPLLFETGADSDVDVSIVVSSPSHLQRARALARPSMTEEHFNFILARQMPDAEKRKRATHVIENNGSLENLRQRTTNLITQLQGSRSGHA